MQKLYFRGISYYSVVKKNPAITQRELANAIGKSERIVKTRTLEMQEKGFIIRENGKRNGKWKVLVEI